MQLGVFKALIKEMELGSGSGELRVPAFLRKNNSEIEQGRHCALSLRELIFFEIAQASLVLCGYRCQSHLSRDFELQFERCTPSATYLSQLSFPARLGIDDSTGTS